MTSDDTPPGRKMPTDAKAIGAGTEGSTPEPSDNGHNDKGPDRADVLDIGFLLLLLWRGKVVILAAIILAGAFAYYSVTKYSPKYTARMIIATSEGDTSLEMVSRIGEILGARRGTSEGPSKMDRLKALMGSVRFAEHLDERYGYLKTVYSGLWDEPSGTWVQPDNFRTNLAVRVARLTGVPEWTPPDYNDLADQVRALIKITEIRNSNGIYELTVAYPDPDFAVRLLSDVYHEAEIWLRDEERGRSVGRMSYLEKKLSKITVGDMRQAIVALIAKTESELMLVDESLPYLGSLIDPPGVNSRPSQPSAIMYAAFAIVGGSAIGSLVVLIWHFFRTAMVRTPSRRKRRKLSRTYGA